MYYRKKKINDECAPSLDFIALRYPFILSHKCIAIYKYTNKALQLLDYPIF